MANSRYPSRPVRPSLALLPLVLLLGVSCGGGSGGGSPTDPGVQSAAAVEATSFQLVNQARSDAGLAPLQYDPAIADVARRHSEEMRDLDYLAHVDPSGKSFSDRLRDAGIPFTKAGENLGRVENASDPAGFLHQRFLASPDHRTNLLDPDFTRIGIGAARQGNTWWVTQDFVR